MTFGAILLTPQRRPGLSGKKKGSGQPAMNRSKEAAMTIKSLVVLLVGLTLASIRFAEGQQAGKKVPVLGVLLPDTAPTYASYLESFRQGLRELGHVEGKNIAIEYRYGEGKLDRLPELAAEVVRLKVDIIVVAGGALAAAKQATNTIPIVVATAGDLVGDGYVASLARPGGNITGSTNIDSDLSPNRLELLKQTLPKLSRVAFLSREGNRGDQDELRRHALRPQPWECGFNPWR